eukprot:TRINITY_DN3046_c0_g1_i1.p1 TRINITY_DN3046_c0_g1~~TRINITY_DN3046_c0_g1_i1.p1  ORF type:complete len:396 (-),score=72.00 TRINITY_DN3046_c0_g1_i1:276-1463(-)
MDRNRRRIERFARNFVNKTPDENQQENQQENHRQIMPQRSITRFDAFSKFQNLVKQRGTVSKTELGSPQSKTISPTPRKVNYLSKAKVAKSRRSLPRKCSPKLIPEPLQQTLNQKSKAKIFNDASPVLKRNNIENMNEKLTISALNDHRSNSNRNSNEVDDCKESPKKCKHNEMKKTEETQLSSKPPLPKSISRNKISSKKENNNKEILYKKSKPQVFPIPDEFKKQIPQHETFEGPQVVEDINHYEFRYYARVARKDFDTFGQCDECMSEHASVNCMECKTHFCDDCFVSCHSKGQRQYHIWQDYVSFVSALTPYCWNCGSVPAHIHCEECDAPMCMDCFFDEHEGVEVSTDPSIPSNGHDYMWLPFGILKALEEENQEEFDEEEGETSEYYSD